ncbi:hypothetical protein ATJ88_1182 [Isoptericola jiangsuensis]|uniref:Uncharacterized protein n=1 Tax=Isoptericola jiangsuensis TaxID=548579 RepID=A0A2A9EW63_9MICO|nr:hypothetical protein [Isoptericola jiangsuensis]PFG42520.1 hypothetical protein ATJ88_1182 [Isoptericola jiangsuensis]
MTTTPSDAWRDAGLEEPDEVTSLVDEAERDTTPPRGPDTEEYRPRTARPDLDGSADEADVAEQASDVPDGSDDPDVG